jgi:hypothetical protein
MWFKAAVSGIKRNVFAIGQSDPVTLKSLPDCRCSFNNSVSTIANADDNFGNSQPWRSIDRRLGACLPKTFIKRGLR